MFIYVFAYLYMYISISHTHEYILFHFFVIFSMQNYLVRLNLQCPVSISEYQGIQELGLNLCMNIHTIQFISFRFILLFFILNLFLFLFLFLFLSLFSLSISYSHMYFTYFLFILYFRIFRIFFFREEDGGTGKFFSKIDRMKWEDM
jgi:hypothetical protein